MILNTTQEKKECLIEALNRGYTNKELASIFSISTQGMHNLIETAKKNKHLKFNDKAILKDTQKLKKNYPNIDPIILKLELICLQDKKGLNTADAINYINENGIKFKESTKRIVYKNKRYKNLDEFLKKAYPECPGANVFCYELNKYIKNTRCSRNEAIEYVMTNRKIIFARGFIYEGVAYKNRKQAIISLVPKTKYENVCSLMSQYQRIYKISREEAFTLVINKYKQSSKEKHSK